METCNRDAGHFDPVAGTVPYYTPVAELVTNGQINGPFQRPQAGTFGSGRNPFYGPRFFNADMSLFKNFGSRSASQRNSGLKRSMSSTM